eukprot:6491115-Amphidinium_carterae.2
MDRHVTWSSQMMCLQIGADGHNAKSVNKGYLPEQSREHLIDGLDSYGQTIQVSPLEGLQRRMEPDIPTGVFPWKWPKPKPSKAFDSCRDAINVALTMDDNDNQCVVPHDELYKYNPKHQDLTKQAAIDSVLQLWRPGTNQRLA